MALYLLYAIELLFVAGLVSLILGVALKIVSYPTKEVPYINKWGKRCVEIADDTDYHYKPEELWEPPPYWQNWQKVEPPKEELTYIPEINHYGDEDWPHTEQAHV